MPGVNRPYTIRDVLGALAGDNGAVDTAETATGQFGEVDEAASLTDAANTLIQANTGWDDGVWGGFQWN
jgi:hypothetical protein